MAVATPYIARMPSLLIGTAPGTELVCHARKVSLVPTTNTTDVETFCNPGGTAPGTDTWVCEFDALQSYGDTGSPGLWDTLRPLANTAVTFTLKPADGTVSATNPSATFTAWVPSIPFIDAEIGGNTVLTVTCPLVGAPVFATT